MNLRSTVLICLHLAACVASTQNHILRAGPRDKTYAVLDKVDSVLDKELDLLLHDSESPTTQLQSMQPRFTSTDNEDVVGDKATAIVTDGTDENTAFKSKTYSTCREMTGDPYTQPKPHYSNNDIEIGIGTEMCCYEFVLYIIDQSNKEKIPQATNDFNVAMQEHGDKKHWWITKTLEILLGKGFKSKCPVNDKDCLAKHRVWRAMLSTLSLQKTDCGDFSEPSLLVVDEIKDVGKYPGHYGITGSSKGGVENIIHFRNEKGPEKSDGDGFSNKKKSKLSTGTLCYKIRALDKLINIDPDLSINGYTPDVADVVDKLTTEAIVDEKLEE